MRARQTYRERPYRCPRCATRVRRWTWDTDPAPTCPADGAALELADEPRAQATSVITDSIPGGMLIRHGICHPDGTPRRFDSKSEIREVAREAGWCVSGETPKPPRGGFRE